MKIISPLISMTKNVDRVHPVPDPRRQPVAPHDVAARGARRRLGRVSPRPRPRSRAGLLVRRTRRMHRPPVVARRRGRWRPRPLPSSARRPSPSPAIIAAARRRPPSPARLVRRIMPPCAVPPRPSSRPRRLPAVIIATVSACRRRLHRREVGAGHVRPSRTAAAAPRSRRPDRPSPSPGIARHLVGLLSVESAQDMPPIRGAARRRSYAAGRHDGHASPVRPPSRIGTARRRRAAARGEPRMRRGPSGEPHQVGVVQPERLEALDGVEQIVGVRPARARGRGR